MGVYHGREYREEVGRGPCRTRGDDVRANRLCGILAEGVIKKLIGSTRGVQRSTQDLVGRSVKP